MSRLAGRLGRLPPRTVQRVVVEQDLRVPVAPDVELLADHYRPIGGERLPTLLVRSPYGRRGVWGLVYGLSLIHISEPTRLLSISYAVFCLKKKNKKNTNK